MKYYSNNNIFHRALQSKQSSKLRFVCNDCLGLIENGLITEKEDDSDKNEQYASSFGITRQNT